MNHIVKNAVFMATFALIGCTANPNYVADDSPIAQLQVNKINPQPKVALVLGSGGPRGYAHIGILKVLEEHNIHVDLVVGSSVGSLVGAFWSAGYSAAEISEMSKQGGPLTLFDFSLFLQEGWIKGQRLQDYVNNNIAVERIEALQKDYIAVATRKNDGVPVYFQSGNIGVAIRASSAVANIFSPVGIDGVEYIDAEESLPVAVEVARQAGAQFVIAVDVSARPGAAPEGTSEKQLAKDALRRSRIDPQIGYADIVLHPDLDYNAGPWRSYFEAAELEGERYAREMIDQVKDTLSKLNPGESDPNG